MTHVKGLLPSQDYYVKCVAVEWIEQDKSQFRLTFKVDVGEHAWRTIKDTFYTDEAGWVKIWDMCNGINYEPFEDEDDPMFLLQFLGMRAKVKVDRTIEGQFKVNKIIEYGLADVPEETNVMAEPDDSHYYNVKQKRSLPV